MVRRPRFLLDLAEELTWLNENAGPNVAERWYEALQHTITEVRRHPFLGRERRDLKPKGIRSRRITSFPRWLIFYLIREEAVIFLRVRYGMMNLPALEFKS